MRRVKWTHIALLTILLLCPASRGWGCVAAGLFGASVAATSIHAWEHEQQHHQHNFNCPCCCGCCGHSHGHHHHHH